MDVGKKVDFGDGFGFGNGFGNFRHLSICALVHCVCIFGFGIVGRTDTGTDIATVVLSNATPSHLYLLLHCVSACVSSYYYGQLVDYHTYEYTCSMILECTRVLQHVHTVYSSTSSMLAIDM